MNKREENKYTMYKAVEKILDDNISIINKFKEALNNLSAIDNQYLTITKGASDKKKNSEKQLIKYLINISSALYVYGRKEGNEDLMSVSKINKSMLKKVRDTGLLQIAKAIYQKANENKDNIKDYGISDTNITDFNSILKAYDESLSSMESRGAQSKAARKTLSDEFNNVDEILKEDIDKLARILNDKNPVFYEDYKSSRVIKDI